jgi:hypothetical protein
LERLLDLAAEALRERLRDRDPLPPAAERERVEVVRVRVLRRLLAARVRPARRLLEQRDLGLLVLLEVGRVDDLRLHRGVETGPADLGAGVDRVAEAAGMERGPRG